jgi:hypothetical protein
MTTLRGSVMARAHTARRPPAAPRQDALTVLLIEALRVVDLGLTRPQNRLQRRLSMA